jgi:hypothetical protein
VLRTHCVRAFWFVTLLALIFGCTSSAVGAKDPKSDAGDPQHSLPLNEWLSQGEQKAFACEIRIFGPALTFQQRYRVWVRAKFPAPSLQRESIQRDLHFFIKVADETGRWFDGQTYNHLRIEKKFNKKVELVLDGGLYLQPGTYTVAVVVYDAVLREHNVAFRHVTVKPPKHDSLPMLLSAVPKVEFPPDPVEGVASLESGHASLPVQTDRPVELDVIVDLTPYAAATVITAGPDPWSGGLASTTSVGGSSMGSNGPGIPRPPVQSSVPMRRPIPAGMRRGEKGFQSRLLEAASVVSDIDIKNGCTRVTVFNALNMRTLMTAEPALSADWLKTWDEVLNTNLNLISVDELAGSVEAAKFFSDQVETLMSQPPSCNANASRPLRVLALFSRGAHFPEGTIQVRIQPKCDCKVFYLREHEDVTDLFDDLRRMLAPLSVRRLEFSDPGQFRHKLSELINRIQELGAD